MVLSQYLVRSLFMITMALTFASCADEAEVAEEDAAEDEDEMRAEFKFPPPGDCTPFGTGLLNITTVTNGDEATSQTIEYDCLVTPSVNDQNILHFQFYDQLNSETPLMNLVTFSVTIHGITEPGTFPHSSSNKTGTSYVGISQRTTAGEAYDAAFGFSPFFLQDSGSIIVSDFTLGPPGSVEAEFENIKLKPIVSDEGLQEEVTLTINGTVSISESLTLH